MMMYYDALPLYPTDSYTYCSILWVKCAYAVRMSVSWGDPSAFPPIYTQLPTTPYFYNCVYEFWICHFDRCMTNSMFMLKLRTEAVNLYINGLTSQTQFR